MTQQNPPRKSQKTTPREWKSWNAVEWIPPSRANVSANTVPSSPTVKRVRPAQASGRPQPARKTLRLSGQIIADGDLVEWKTVRLDGVHHVVHEYANFVSSAEMATTGKHLGKGFDPPVNTHISHAFLLNCRKMADFFENVPVSVSN